MDQDMTIRKEMTWYSAQGSSSWTYTITPDRPELRAILMAVSVWHVDEMADMVEQRMGYGNTDGGVGMIYPESDRASAPIPPNHVEVYTYGGPPDGEAYHVAETLYLDVLSLYLNLRERTQAAERVDRVRDLLSPRKRQ